MSVRRDWGWAAAAALTLSGTRFAVAAVLTRRLEQDLFGKYAYVQWLVDIGFVICSLGATGAVSRFTAEYRHRPQVVAAILSRWRAYAVGLPLLGASAALVGGRVSGMEISSGAEALVGAWGLAFGLWGMQTAALTGLQRFDLIFRANMTAGLLMIGGVATLPIENIGLGGVFALMAGACFAGSIVGWKSTFASTAFAPVGLAKGTWSKVHRYAFNVWLTTILWTLVWSRGELPVVRAFLGDQGVAEYAAALTLLGGAIAGVMVGVGGVTPELTRLLGEGRTQSALNLARRVMELQLLVAGCAACVFVWLAPELMALVFGPEYRDAAPILSALSASVLAFAASTQNHLLQIATDARFNRNTTLIGLLLLTTGTMAMAPLTGLFGIAVVRSFTLLLLGGLGLWFVGRRWDRAAVATPGLAVVPVVVASGMIMVLALPRMGLGSRAFGASGSILTLLLFFRDREGRALAEVLRSSRPTVEATTP